MPIKRVATARELAYLAKRRALDKAVREYRKAYAVLQKCGLPSKLLYLLKTGSLYDAVQRAYAKLDRLNDLLDIWEEENPHAAAIVPWAEARRAWKDAGRPRAEWYEVIQWSEKTDQVPLGSSAIDHNLYTWAQQARNRRVVARRSKTIK